MQTGCSILCKPRVPHRRLPGGQIGNQIREGAKSVVGGDRAHQRVVVDEVELASPPGACCWQQAGKRGSEEEQRPQGIHFRGCQSALRRRRRGG